MFIFLFNKTLGDCLYLIYWYDTFYITILYPSPKDDGSSVHFVVYLGFQEAEGIPRDRMKCRKIIA